MSEAERRDAETRGAIMARLNSIENTLNGIATRWDERDKLCREHAEAISVAKEAANTARGRAALALWVVVVGILPALLYLGGWMVKLASHNTHQSTASQTADYP